MHPVLGGYRIGDIEFTVAIDINRDKVGKDLSQAILAPPNCTKSFAHVPHKGVTVVRGMTHDGIGTYLSQVIHKADGPTADIASLLRETKTDVLVNFLPVGSEMATKWYVEQALEGGCGFINCIPVFIASGWVQDAAGAWKQTNYWSNRFKRAGLPLIGDDIKSQVGATILHRTLVNLFLDRGMPIDRTYQLNTGGNTDFLNMKEEARLISKRRCKTNAVVSQIAARGLEIKRRRRLRRPLGLRALAEGQQALLPAHREPPLRRRADEPGVPPLGRGLPQLRRRRHRRDPLRQDRPRPRHRRRCSRPPAPTS